VAAETRWQLAIGDVANNSGEFLQFFGKH